MGDVGDSFDGWKEHSQEKRADNRSMSAGILRDRGVSFTEKNMGAHLIVEGKECLIDFWPGTGKYITRTGNKGRGVFNLLKLVSTKKPA